MPQENSTEDNTSRRENNPDMPVRHTITVSEFVHEHLIEIRKRDGHSSLDSALRSLIHDSNEIKLLKELLKQTKAKIDIQKQPNQTSNLQT